MAGAHTMMEPSKSTQGWDNRSTHEDEAVRLHKVAMQGLL
jgi:hypothetical protein